MFKRIVAGLALLFAGVLLAFTAWRTYHLLSLTSPGDVILPALGLVVFDLGFVCWTLIFLHLAEGFPQRAAALCGAVADLGLVIVAVVADLFLHGQTLTAVPAWVGLAALLTISLAVAVNLTLVFIFHITSPNALAALRERARQDRIEEATLKEEQAIEDLAFKELHNKRRAIAEDVAEGKAQEMLDSLLERMRAKQYAPPRPDTPRARNGRTPEAAYPAEAPAPGPKLSGGKK